MKEQKLYKVKHKESGLYWKGGGMNTNNKSMHHIWKKVDGKMLSTSLQYDYEPHALEVCFSQIGKTWSSFGAVKSALGYGHESGLNSLLKKCVIMEIEFIEKEVDNNGKDI